MMDMTHPFVFEGNDLVTNGVEDAYPIEGGIYQQYSVEAQAFQKKSEIISLAGESAPCAWNQSTSASTFCTSYPTSVRPISKAMR